MKFFRDTATVFSREFAPALRDPIGLVFAMALPLLFLFLFGSLLNGASALGGSPWQWFVPGILIMMCLFGPMGAGHSLLIELTGGSMERMLVTPLNRTAMLIGRTMKELATLLAQAVLIIALAMTLGFRLHPAGVLAGLALLVVFGIGLSALSFVLAIKSQPGGELFWTVTQTMMFPVVLLSGMLLPLDFAPSWLKTAGALNPVTYLVNAQRALFNGEIITLPVLYGTITACGTALIGLALGNRVMRRGI
jgi:ABC-2 type transport system permease protein